MTSPVHLRIDDHLELRQRTPPEAEEMFALTDANRAYLKPWFSWLDGCASVSDTLKYIESSLREAAAGTALGLSILEDRKIVGAVGFNSIAKSNRIGVIGYWLDQGHQGRGIMTRSVRALVGYGFEHLGLNRITIAAAVDNRPSRAVAERLGFHFEGIAKQAEWLYGRVVDHAIYAMTYDDWGKSGQRCEDAAGIRGLQARELPAAIALWQSTAGVGLAPDETAAKLTSVLDRNPGISSAAIDADGKLIGAVLGGHDGRRGYLYHLAVSDAHRGAGIGRALVQRTAEQLAQAGIARATIFVYADNAEGRAFWEHLGWKTRQDLQSMQLHL